MTSAARNHNPHSFVADTSTLPEYGEVKLLRDVLYKGIWFPKGSTGVVVDIHENGVGYEVEFSTPAEEVVGLCRDDLRAV